MRRPDTKHEPLDAVVGAIGGLLFGITSGVIFWLFMVPGLSPQSLVAALFLIAVACAGLGYWKGNDFFRWLRDHWFDW